MLGKRAHPVIRKLSALLISGNRAEILDVGSSPRGPLMELKINQSPTRGGLRCYDVGGVGLGIVAALENKSSDRGYGILGKCSVCSSSSSSSTNSSLNKSSIRPPIPVKNCERCFQDLEEESLESEDYTFVTCHGPNKSVITRVYYDHGAETADTTIKESDESGSYYPTSDFLSSCHLCRKNLQGRDIYMYRGEKGFCSNECRSTQIMKDERKEQCRADAPRSADVASSPYTRDHIFSTGILAI